MNTNYLYLAALLLCFASCKKEVPVTEETIVKTDSLPEVAEMEMDSVAKQKAWADYMTPSEAHKQLANHTGTWNEELTFWMGPDDKNPQKSTAVAETKMILNGMYQESIHKGNIMGMAFEGRSTLAYDNAVNQYVSTWIDNMSSGVIILKGNYDADSKKMELIGECSDPLTKKYKKVRETMTIIDENTQKMEMFDVTPEGQEFKSMEINLTRKK